MTMTTVWTIVVERNRVHETNFTKPWEPQKGFEAYRMYGPSDHPQAWETAQSFLVNKLQKHIPEYKLVGILKGDFAKQFYFAAEPST